VLECIQPKGELLLQAKPALVIHQKLAAFLTSTPTATIAGIIAGVAFETGGCG
jgi:hypothetical protein